MTKSIPLYAAVLLAIAVPASAEELPQTAAVETMEIPQVVKDACKNDYDRNCSAHVPGTPAARECMVRAFEKLSDGCVAAILDSTLAETAVQDVAKAQNAAHAASADAHTDESKPKAHVAAESQTIAIAKHEVRTAQARPAKRIAKGPRDKHERTYVTFAARHRAPARRSVAGYVRRGTGIADYYVSKYTRFALAKVFH